MELERHFHNNCEIHSAANQKIGLLNALTALKVVGIPQRKLREPQVHDFKSQSFLLFHRRGSHWWTQSSFKIDICCSKLGYVQDVVTNEAIIMKRMESTKKYNRLIYKERRKEEDWETKGWWYCIMKLPGAEIQDSAGGKRNAGLAQPHWWVCHVYRVRKIEQLYTIDGPASDDACEWSMMTMVLEESSTFVACLHKQIPFDSFLDDVRKQSLITP